MKKIFNKLIICFILIIGLFLFVSCNKNINDKETYIVYMIYGNGEVDKKIKVESGELLDIPQEPTCEGFDFLGWFVGDEKYNFNEPIYSNITIEAQWKITEYYTITFVLFDKSTKVVEYKAEEIPTELEVSQEGYEFIGWYLENNGILSADRFSFEDYIIDKNIKLVSLWKNFNCNVTFCYNNINKDDTITIKRYSFVDKPIDPVMEGYEFKGWFEKADDGINYKNEAFDFKNQIEDDITLYAKWEEKFNYINEFQDEMENRFKEISFTNFNLPVTFNGISNIIWESDNEKIINNGKITRPYKKTVVNLNAIITLNNNDEKTVSFDINVPGYKLEDATTIASTYLSRNYSSMDDNFFDTMDIIFVAFANINDTGDVTGSSFFKNCKNYILPKAKEKGVYVVMSLAPGSSWTVFCDPTNHLVDKVVNNVMDKVDEYGFDGVDIDWEKPASGQETWFTNLASKLNKKLKEKDPSMLLTAAIGGGKWQPPFYDLPNSIQYLDYTNMMTYGMEKSSKHYHNALYKKTGSTLVSCSIDESVVIYNGLGVPNKKILVGLAMYGIKQTYTDGSWGNGKSVLNNTLISDYLNNDNYIKYYDEVAGVPYLLSKDGTEFISYENERSIIQKCEYVKDKKIGGVMTWEAGCDVSGSLVKAIKQGLNK